MRTNINFYFINQTKMKDINQFTTRLEKEAYLKGFTDGENSKNEEWVTKLKKWLEGLMA